MALALLSLNEATVNLRLPLSKKNNKKQQKKTTDIHSPLCSNMMSNISKVWAWFASSALCIQEDISMKALQYI